MNQPVALVMDESAFRRAIRSELESLHPKSDGRTAEASRHHLPDAKAWLTNAEAQEYLGLSRMTLQRYRDAGKLKYSKVGSNVFYRLEDIESLLESGMKEAGR